MPMPITFSAVPTGPRSFGWRADAPATLAWVEAQDGGDPKKKADVRLAALHTQGSTQAQLYGRDDTVYGGLNAFFLLMDKPETYGLPNASNAGLPSRNDVGGYLAAFVTAVVGVVAGIVAFRRRGES